MNELGIRPRSGNLYIPSVRCFLLSLVDGGIIGPLYWVSRDSFFRGGSEPCLGRCGSGDVLGNGLLGLLGNVSSVGELSGELVVRISTFFAIVQKKVFTTSEKDEGR